MSTNFKYIIEHTKVYNSWNQEGEIPAWKVYCLDEKGQKFFDPATGLKHDENFHRGHASMLSLASLDNEQDVPSYEDDFGFLKMFFYAEFQKRSGYIYDYQIRLESMPSYYLPKSSKMEFYNTNSTKGFGELNYYPVVNRFNVFPHTEIK